MQQLKELVFTLQELVSYEKYINNAQEFAKRAVPKGIKDHEKRMNDSFNYILEVHLGDDVKSKFLRARLLENKLYKNSKKYVPLMDKGIGKALSQASLIYEAFLRKADAAKNKI